MFKTKSEEVRTLWIAFSILGIPGIIGGMGLALPHIGQVAAILMLAGMFVLPVPMLFLVRYDPDHGSGWSTDDVEYCMRMGWNLDTVEGLADQGYSLEEIEQIINNTETIPDHPTAPSALFYGFGGSGKTTLTRLYKKEIEKYYGHEIDFIQTVPANIRSKRDLDKLILDIYERPYCMVLIDEIHRLDMRWMEAMYSAMQDSYYDIQTSEMIELNEENRLYLETDASTQRLELPPFTIIGATTDFGKLTNSLVDRFTMVVELQTPSEEEMAGVIRAYLNKSGPQDMKEYAGQDHAKKKIWMHLKAMEFTGSVQLSEDAVSEIARRSFYVPRIGVQRTKDVIAWAKNYAAQRDMTDITVDRELVDRCLNEDGVDHNGLLDVHRRILKVLIEKDKPMGRQNLASASKVKKEDIENRFFPELRNLGYLDTDGRGWITITEAAKEEYGG